MSKSSTWKNLGGVTLLLFAVFGAFGCNKGGSDAPAPTQTTSAAPTMAPAGGGGVDSIDKLTIPEITYSTAAADIEKGKAAFTAKGCNACHKVGEGKLVGPDLKGVTARREIKWIEKMILRPDLMIKQDDTAKDLFKTYMTPMANQNVDPVNELPFLLAYLKANEV